MEDIKTGKEGLLVNKETHFKNLKRELEQIASQLKDQNEMIALTKKKDALAKANFDIAFTKFKMINPTWEFEKDSKFMDNRKELDKVAMREREITSKVQMRQLESVKESLVKQQESLQQEYDRVKAELEKMKR